MKRPVSILVAALAAGLSFASPPGPSPQDIKIKPVKIPHEIAGIVDKGGGKVEADLTSQEIVVTNTQREGSLYLKLFRDYERVPGKNIVYRDPLRFPLSEGSVYAVWISSESGFGAATFQLFRGKLHIIRQD